MDPLGQYLWIGTEYRNSGCGQTTDTWKFNADTGVPTFLETGQGGCGLLTRADTSGKFVYLIGNTSQACGSSGTTPGIWGLSLNRANGALTNLPGSPWASPNSDWFLSDGLVITP
jgi:hypothetical protein